MADNDPFRTIDGTWRVWCKCCTALHYLTEAQAQGPQPYDCRLQDVSDVPGLDQFADFIASIDAGVCAWVKVAPSKSNNQKVDPYDPEIWV